MSNWHNIKGSNERHKGLTVQINHQSVTVISKNMKLHRNISVVSKYHTTIPVLTE